MQISSVGGGRMRRSHQCVELGKKVLAHTQKIFLGLTEKTRGIDYNASDQYLVCMARSCSKMLDLSNCTLEHRMCGQNDASPA